MRLKLEGRFTRQSCSSLVLSTSLICLPLGILFAQKTTPPPAAPKYDVQTEVKIKGTVLEIKAPEKEKDALHLVIKNGEETLDVELCPKSYLEEMGTTLTKGDAIGLTGSKVKVNEATLILAREVNKGDEMLVLRDGKGAPVWNWKH